MRVFRRIRRLLRNQISTSPLLYSLITSRGKTGYRVVTSLTDLVLEGFPRSGNSFAEAAILCSQGDGIKLAHHTHAAANVLRAVQLGKPCYVLLRAPADCCISLVIQEGETHDLTLALSEYERFHRAISPVANRICLVPFEVATRDFDRSIDHLNAIYGTRFVHPPPGMTRETIMARTDEVSRSRGTVQDGVEPYSPFASERVKAQRAEHQAALREELRDPKHAPRLARCEALYQALLQQAAANGLPLTTGPAE